MLCLLARHAVSDGAATCHVCLSPRNTRAQEPPGGGLRPAGVIASYITCALSAQLQAQAWTAVNAFALLQAPALHSSGRAPGGAPSGAQAPSAGGPAVPLGVPGITGLGALAGPVHGGMAALAHSHHHGGAHGHQSRVLTMLDGGGSARGERDPGGGGGEAGASVPCVVVPCARWLLVLLVLRHSTSLMLPRLNA
jgi:hypothetical protein